MSDNPVFSEKSFKVNPQDLTEKPMTLNGTIIKTFILTLIVCLAGAYGWSQGKLHPNLIGLFVMGGGILGFAIALITTFKKEWSPVLSLVYSLAEGVFLGAMSLIFEMKYPGIVSQTVLCTIGVTFSCLFLYRSGLIKVDEKFKSVIFMATAAIGLVYLATFALSFFNIQIPYIHNSGLIGIGFSVFTTIIASLNLLVDFDFIDQASANGSFPNYMEWYGAFGLMVTLVWVYIEILRLLSKLRRN